MENITNGLNSFGGEQGKYTENEAKLWAYLLKLPKHPQVIEHKGIAASFNVSNYRPIFKSDAERRLIDTISKEPSTAATVSEITGVKHKYLCQLVANFKEKRVIEVLELVTCPTTSSPNVQLLAPVKP